MKRFKAIIFDMDGVIVDSEPLHERAFREIFAEMGYGENHGVDFAAYYGRSDLALWIDFVAKHGPKQPLEELVEWKHSRLVKNLREKQPIFPGLPELLEKCAARYRLGVASGSAHRVINEVLAMQNLRRFFSAVISAEDVAEGKPAPDIFLRSAELLGVEARECCVIEDSAAGIEGALAAGMSVIAITNSLPAEKLARATSIVRDYAEIELLLLE
ncbi:MAG: HAD family phosphatase [Verrucomicrobiota bacterium]